MTSVPKPQVHKCANCRNYLEMLIRVWWRGDEMWVCFSCLHNFYDKMSLQDFMAREEAETAGFEVKENQ